MRSFPSLSLRAAALLAVLLLTAAPAAVCAQQVAVIRIPARSLAYDPKTRKIYATVGECADLARVNSLTIIDPETGTVDKSIYLGSQAPGQAVLSDGGRYLYIAQRDAHEIRRYDVAAQKLEDPFPVSGGFSAGNLLPLPGDPRSVIVLRQSGGSPGDEGVAVYTDGKERHDTAKAGYILVPGLPPGRFFGYNNRESDFSLTAVGIDEQGVYSLGGVQGALSGNVAYVGMNGLMIANNGGVFDPEARRTLGQFPDTGLFASLVPDPERGLVFQIKPARDGSELIAYDVRTQQRVSVLRLPALPADAAPRLPAPPGRGFGNPIRWGDDGLAFTTDKAVVLVRAGLGPKIPPVNLSLGRTVLSRPNARPASYTLTVRNESATPATGVCLTDTLPDGADVSDCKASQGSATASGGLMRAQLGDLAPGASATVTVTLKLLPHPRPFRPVTMQPRPGDFAVFTAVVRGWEPDPHPENNIAIDDVSRYLLL